MAFVGKIVCLQPILAFKQSTCIASLKENGPFRTHKIVTGSMAY